MKAYADTSVFVSLYLPDVHSVAAQAWLSGGDRLWFTPLHAAEFFHAVSLQVFHRKSSQVSADKVFDNLKRDRLDRIWLEIGVPDSAFELCAALARRHTPGLGTRTLDSLHVACALELKAERFWTFDERQAKLARAEGLKTS